MSSRKQLLWIFLLAGPVVLVLLLLLGALITESATAHASECQTCHDQLASKTAMRQCKACHEVSDLKLRVAAGVALYPKAHFDPVTFNSPLEEQYDFDEIVVRGEILCESGGDSHVQIKGWTMTGDLPNWNALIDERPLVLENDD